MRKEPLIEMYWFALGCLTFGLCFLPFIFQKQHQEKKFKDMLLREQTERIERQIKALEIKRDAELRRLRAINEHIKQ